ncbi:MAG: hypothetical protein WC715_03610 [Patescibacteria group bacterium]|jgi:hypothetical protein
MANEQEKGGKPPIEEKGGVGNELTPDEKVLSEVTDDQFHAMMNDAVLGKIDPKVIKDNEEIFKKPSKKRNQPKNQGAAEGPGVTGADGEIVLGTSESPEEALKRQIKEGVIYDSSEGLTAEDMDKAEEDYARAEKEPGEEDLIDETREYDPENKEVVHLGEIDATEDNKEDRSGKTYAERTGGKRLRKKERGYEEREFDKGSRMQRADILSKDQTNILDESKIYADSPHRGVEAAAKKVYGSDVETIKSKAGPMERLKIFAAEKLGIGSVSEKVGEAAKRIIKEELETAKLTVGVQLRAQKEALTQHKADSEKSLKAVRELGDDGLSAKSIAEAETRAAQSNEQLVKEVEAAKRALESKIGRIRDSYIEEQEDLKVALEDYTGVYETASKEKDQLTSSIGKYEAVLTTSKDLALNAEINNKLKELRWSLEQVVEDMAKTKMRLDAVKANKAEIDKVVAEINKIGKTDEELKKEEDEKKKLDKEERKRKFDEFREKVFGKEAEEGKGGEEKKSGEKGGKTTEGWQEDEDIEAGEKKQTPPSSESGETKQTGGGKEPAGEKKTSQNEESVGGQEGENVRAGEGKKLEAGPLKPRPIKEWFQMFKITNIKNPKDRQARNDSFADKDGDFGYDTVMSEEDAKNRLIKFNMKRGGKMRKSKHEAERDVVNLIKRLREEKKS